MDAIKKKKLAYEIAYGLDDLNALAWHEVLVGKYSEDFLKEMMHKALAIKEEKVHTTRGRLYTWLVQSNGGRYPRN
jgi:hypothetical protein